ncbi:MAG TPA: DUF1016 N-terminal domain-containing protein [Polyangiales bacterium]
MTLKRRPARPALYGRVRAILDAARTSVARTVNTTQVVANWMIGREIVEEEQAGKRRARYRAALLAELSERLALEFGSGYSPDNLEAFRKFYLEYPGLISETLSRSLPAGAISETASRKSGLATDAGKWKPGVLHSNLSWSHYRSLLRVDRAAARAFYEIEAINNAWSVRELLRQTGSLLFERLAKSRDKRGLMKLATRGQEVAKPADVFKDPTVIEFVGLPESQGIPALPLLFGTECRGFESLWACCLPRILPVVGFSNGCREDQRNRR